MTMYMHSDCSLSLSLFKRANMLSIRKKNLEFGIGESKNLTNCHHLMAHTYLCLQSMGIENSNRKHFNFKICQSI